MVGILGGHSGFFDITEIPFGIHGFATDNKTIVTGVRMSDAGQSIRHKIGLKVNVVRLVEPK